jgi:hypothetical protein
VTGKAGERLTGVEIPYSQCLVEGCRGDSPCVERSQSPDALFMAFQSEQLSSGRKVPHFDQLVPAAARRDAPFIELHDALHPPVMTFKTQQLALAFSVP